MRVDTMIDRVVARFIGTKHERDLKLIQPLVSATNALAPEFENLSDAQLLEKTVQLRAEVQGRLGDVPLDDPTFKERCKEALEPALVPAFAHYDLIHTRLKTCEVRPGRAGIALRRGIEPDNQSICFECHGRITASAGRRYHRVG